MDDGRGGIYRSIVGYLQPFLVPTLTVTGGITRGLTYRFRYRARNCKGWSAFSDELYVLAAQKPSAPPPVERISASSTTLSLKLFPTFDNGGTVVTDYELFRNDGLDGVTFYPITGYDYSVNGFTVNIDVDDEGMVVGRFYQIVFRAKNILGNSDYSPVVAFGIADLPSKPATPYEIHGGLMQKT